jgi:hypothetical protein
MTRGADPKAAAEKPNRAIVDAGDRLGDRLGPQCLV